MWFQYRIGWYEHILHRSISTENNQVLDLEVERKHRKGRPRKTWVNCAREEQEELNLKDSVMDSTQ